MTNLTAEALVRSADTLQATSQYALVVLEDAEKGPSVLKTILPGQAYVRPWSLFSRRTVTGYWVDLDDQLRHRWSVKRLHQGPGSRGITLDIELRYRVLPPKSHLLVDRLESDPLGQVVSEAGRILSEPVIRLPWALIEASTNVTEHAVHAEGEDDDGILRSAQERLKRYADKRGLDIRGISVHRHLDEKETALDRERLELDQEKKRAELRLEAREYEHRDLVHQQVLEDERRRIKDDGETMHQLTTASVRKKVEFIQGGRSLADVDDIVRQGSPPWSGATPNTAPRLLAGAGKASQVFESTEEHADGRDRAKALLASAYDSANALPCDAAERMRFLSSILKVIASLLAEEGPEARESHQRELRDQYERYVRLLPDHSSDFVEKLTNQTTL